MPSSYTADIARGWASPYKIGSMPNTWGNRLTALAHKLDALPMSPEVAETLREVFEEAARLANPGIR